MKKRTYRLLCVLAGTVLLVTGALTGCSTSGKSGASKGDGIQQTEEAGAAEKHAPKIDGLEYKKTMKLKYATGFDVYYYKEGYKLLDVHEDRQYLIVPEGKKKPADLDKEIVVLKTAIGAHLSRSNMAMALFDAMDGLDRSGCREHRLRTGILIMRRKQWKTVRSCLQENTANRIMKC